MKSRLFMNENLKKITGVIKNPKALIILGICGIVLIFISSLFDTDTKDKSTKKENESSFSAEEYRIELEEAVLGIVKSITGDKSATVVVTLDSSVRYDYADSFDTSSSNSLAEASQNESSSSSKTYITFRTEEGGEKPLIVTEIMPEVRGVAVVCSGGNNAEVAEKIQNAVMAALNITSKRVYITGGSKFETN